MTGNGYGSYRTTRVADMAAYDDAPPPLRWLMRNAVADWAAENLADRYWNSRRAVGHQRAMTLIAQNIALQARDDTLAAYGPTHPDAAVMTEYFA